MQIKHIRVLVVETSNTRRVGRVLLVFYFLGICGGGAARFMDSEVTSIGVEDRSMGIEGV